MRAWAGLAAVVLLAGCAFSSERPLFESNLATQPFQNGAEFFVEEHVGTADIARITYRRVGAGYEIVASGSERPMHILFIPIQETPEEDYVGQIDFDGAGFAYVFMWRHGEGQRLIIAPGAIEGEGRGDTALARHCVTRPSMECSLSSGRAVIDLYLEAIYEPYVQHGLTFHGMIEQVPVGSAREERVK